MSLFPLLSPSHLGPTAWRGFFRALFLLRTFRFKCAFIDGLEYLGHPILTKFPHEYQKRKRATNYFDSNNISNGPASSTQGLPLTRPANMHRSLPRTMSPPDRPRRDRSRSRSKTSRSPGYRSKRGYSRERSRSREKDSVRPRKDRYRKDSRERGGSPERYRTRSREGDRDRRDPARGVLRPSPASINGVPRGPRSAASLRSFESDLDKRTREAEEYNNKQKVPVSFYRGQGHNSPAGTGKLSPGQ